MSIKWSDKKRQSIVNWVCTNWAIQVSILTASNTDLFPKWIRTMFSRNCLFPKHLLIAWDAATEAAASSNGLRGLTDVHSASYWVLMLSIRLEITHRSEFLIVDLIFLCFTNFQNILSCKILKFQKSLSVLHLYILFQNN